MKYDSIFSYELPQQRIAQRPVHPPESAKLLLVDRERGKISDSVFSQLPTELDESYLLVVNSTKVLPARVFGEVEGKAVELLLLQQQAEYRWTAIGRPMKRFVEGTEIFFPMTGKEVGFSAKVVSRMRGSFLVEFESDSTMEEILECIGSMPIPPYIRKGRADKQDAIDYQPCFAEHVGAIAAPTASLHFSPNLLKALEAKGVQRASITLHLGESSFRTISHRPDGSVMPPGAESTQVCDATFDRIKAHREQGGKVIAVGTSVVRALEFAARKESHSTRFEQNDLFITPGFEFKLVDGIITNFHQPGTTHLLLVEAFLGAMLLREAYGHALSGDYRFLSYGDGMLLL